MTEFLHSYFTFCLVSVERGQCNMLVKATSVLEVWRE